MNRRLLIGLLSGVVLVVVGVILFNSLRTVIIDTNSNLGTSMQVDALVSASAFYRQDNQTRGDGGDPYLIYDLSGVQVVAHATTRLTEPEGPPFDFPPITDPQRVAAYSLTVTNRAIPDFEGEFLAGLYVPSRESESEDFPLWWIAWMARIGEDGDVTFLDGYDEKLDDQIAQLASLLGRTDQAALLIDWVKEGHAEREGAEPGPITLRFRREFLPPDEPPPPMPSLEVPLLIKVEAAVNADSIDKVLVRPGGLVADEFVPPERLLSEGSGTMTAIMVPEDRMRIEVWGGDLPTAATSLEFADWETILSGDAGGVAITITQDEQGTYMVTAEILSIPNFNQALAEATN